MENGNFKNTIFDKNLNNNLIETGTYLQNNVLYKTKKYFLQLQIYYDDFETANPIGSKATCHKMGAIYFTIKNLPVYYNSTLENIYLLALFYTNDLDEIKLNSILRPIVDDLKILESDGIIVNGFDEPIFGTLTSLSHDNLGANQLHGMVLSFQANYFCRICLISKDESQTKSLDNLQLWRNSGQYEEHCKQVKERPHHFGIKYRSILNDLNYFKLCDSVSVDVMHDILEGLIHIDFKFIINNLIENKVISLKQLNERIRIFDYGNKHRSNKPRTILLEKANLNQRASQSWCLAI